MDLCFSGCHIYEEVWIAVFDKELPIEIEFGHIVDCNVVAVEILRIWK